MNSVVFLDVDGVLNHCNWEPPTPHEIEDLIDPECVAKVNRICELTGSVIVLSSSWREIEGGWQEVESILKTRGLKAPMIGATITSLERIQCRWFTGSRFDEIARWLSSRPEFTRWVVLEDNLIDGIPESHLVHVQYGLTDSDVDSAIRILGPV